MQKLPVVATSQSENDPTSGRAVAEGNQDMAIFDLLREEHDQIKNLLAAMISDRKKSDVFEQVRARMEAHIEGEEEHVYPAIRAVGLKDEMLESLEEHHVVKVVLGELEDMSDREEAWLPKLRVFTELIEHHLRQEERKVFPAAEKKIGQTRQEELEAEYRRFTSSAAQSGASLPKGESPFYQGV